MSSYTKELDMVLHRRRREESSLGRSAVAPADVHSGRAALARVPEVLAVAREGHAISVCLLNDLPEVLNGADHGDQDPKGNERAVDGPLPPLDLLLHHLAEPHVEKHGKDQVEARHQQPSNQTGEVLEEGDGVGDHVAQNHDLKDRKAAKRRGQRARAESATAEI